MIFVKSKFKSNERKAKKGNNKGRNSTWVLSHPWLKAAKSGRNVKWVRERKVINEEMELKREAKLTSFYVPHSLPFFPGMGIYL